MNENIEATEVQIGRVLTVGTWLSSLLLGVGLALRLLAPSLTFGPLLLKSGLLVLMATPIARVALSIVAFGRGRDWLYMLFTSIVFILLIGSIIVAFMA